MEASDSAAGGAVAGGKIVSSTAARGAVAAMFN